MKAANFICTMSGGVVGANKEQCGLGGGGNNSNQISIKNGLLFASWIDFKYILREI